MRIVLVVEAQEKGPETLASPDCICNLHLQRRPLIANFASLPNLSTSQCIA